MRCQVQQSLQCNNWEIWKSLVQGVLLDMCPFKSPLTCLGWSPQMFLILLHVPLNVIFRIDLLGKILEKVFEVIRCWWRAQFLQTIITPTLAGSWRAIRTEACGSPCSPSSCAWVHWMWTSRVAASVWRHNCFCNFFSISSMHFILTLVCRFVLGSLTHWGHDQSDRGHLCLKQSSTSRHTNWCLSRLKLWICVHHARAKAHTSRLKLSSPGIDYGSDTML